VRDSTSSSRPTWPVVTRRWRRRTALCRRTGLARCRPDGSRREVPFRGWPRAGAMRWHRTFGRCRGRVQMGCNHRLVMAQDETREVARGIPATVHRLPRCPRRHSLSPPTVVRGTVQRYHEQFFVCRSRTSNQCRWREWHAPARRNAERLRAGEATDPIPSSLCARRCRSLTIGGWTAVRSPVPSPPEGRTGSRARRAAKPGRARLAWPHENSAGGSRRGVHRTCRALPVTFPCRGVGRSPAEPGVCAGLHREVRART
jgi:hypothetical protein